MEKILKSIDRISGWIAGGVLVFPLILAGVLFYNVIGRYMFNRSSDWAFEISWMVFSAHFLCAFAYTLREKAHICVDVLFDRLPTRTKEILNAIYVLVLIVFLSFVMVWHGVPYAAYSWKILQGSSMTMWRPPVYPVKTIIPLAFFVLGLQGIAEIIRSLKIASRKEKRS